jgi:outer membrane protein assembly factor BamB/orotate phosphoribosyltransferase
MGNLDSTVIADNAIDAISHGVRETLLHALKSKALILPSHEVTWSKAGKPNAWLLDTRVLLLNPQVMDWIAQMFWARMTRAGDFQLACLEMTGIPLLIGIQAYGLKIGRQVNGVIIRKERKSNGRMRAIEGELNAWPIIFLDDILNSGDSVIKAASVLKAHGAAISAVWTLIDYGKERGRIRVENVSETVTSEYRLDELNVPHSGLPAIVIPDVFKVVWHRTSVEKRFYHVVPKSSPALDGERLYFGTDSGHFYALRQFDGSMCWAINTKRNTNKGIFSSPLLVGQDVVFGAYNGDVYAVNCESGEIHWQFGEADWVGSSPCACADLGLVIVGLEHALRQQQGSVIALHQESGERMWEFPTRKYVHGSPLYLKQFHAIVVGTNDDDCVCLDARTGHVRWMFNTSGEVKSRPSFAEHAALVIFGCFDTHVYALDARTGALSWKTATEGIMYSEPLIVGERVYATSTDKRLYVLDLRTGSILRTYEASAKLFSSPALINENVYFGTNAGQLLEYNPESDIVTGKHQLPERITNKLVYSETSNLFFASTNDNQIFALRRCDT